MKAVLDPLIHFNGTTLSIQCMGRSRQILLAKFLWIGHHYSEIWSWFQLSGCNTMSITDVLIYNTQNGVLLMELGNMYPLQKEELWGTICNKVITQDIHLANIFKHNQFILEFEDNCWSYVFGLVWWYRDCQGKYKVAQDIFTILSKWSTLLWSCANTWSQYVTAHMSAITVTYTDHFLYENTTTVTHHFYFIFFQCMESYPNDVDVWMVLEQIWCMTCSSFFKTVHTTFVRPGKQ